MLTIGVKEQCAIIEEDFSGASAGQIIYNSVRYGAATVLGGSPSAAAIETAFKSGTDALDVAFPTLAGQFIIEVETVGPGVYTVKYTGPEVATALGALQTAPNNVYLPATKPTQYTDSAGDTVDIDQQLKIVTGGACFNFNAFAQQSNTEFFLSESA